ncbi:putative Methyltransferase domain-containing protein [Vibrio chagasii]|nr:putative Methyltransferase domain-containing protein [Vibrio chagasii]CAH7352685.1 putative Methyltransferase domain-containing protein [Vibrio chagasii]CAH7384962.1 putative Methyltransferase domain-containing protein [Vibrio chagasii]
MKQARTIDPISSVTLSDEFNAQSKEEACTTVQDSAKIEVECSYNILPLPASQPLQTQPINVYIEVPATKTQNNENAFLGLKLTEISAFCAAIVAVMTAGVTVRKYFSDRKGARDQKEIERLEDQLKNLYGPLNELREESKMLYSIFAIELKARVRRVEGKHFKTISYLRKNSINQLEPFDKEILEQIIQISRKHIDFIEDNGWAVQSTELSSLLGKLCAHFRILEILAKEQNVNGPAILDTIYFPLETDGAIDNEINKINSRIKALRGADSKLSRQRRFKMKAKRNNTIKYYDDNADTYYLKTNHIDMSETYNKFRLFVTSGRILDAGCGVGRDTRYFVSQGYKVRSFDLSEKMCEITNSYPFAFCEQLSFLNLSFCEEFDGIWANASLLHVQKRDLGLALKGLTKALKVNGFMYTSFKRRENFSNDDQRVFIFHEKNEILEVIAEQKLNLELELEWQSYKNNDPNAEGFNNYIWKRVR